MTAQRRIFLDTCTLINFAIVGRLSLLREWCGGAGVVTEAIELELVRLATDQPAAKDASELDWLGEPLTIGWDSAAVKKIDTIRRALGGSRTAPLQHLAEAQIIYHIQYVEPSGTFVTDDAPAADFAARRGITVLDTADVVTDCLRAALVGCPEAYEILVALHNMGRGIFLPSSHWHVCPSP